MIDTNNFDIECTTTTFTFPMKERIRTMRLQQAEHAILELRDMGVIELKKPLSFWREELGKLMAMRPTIDADGDDETCAADEKYENSWPIDDDDHDDDDDANRPISIPDYTAKAEAAELEKDLAILDELEAATTKHRGAAKP